MEGASLNLSNRASKTHEISDSESDSEVDRTTPSKSTRELDSPDLFVESTDDEDRASTSKHTPIPKSFHKDADFSKKTTNSSAKPICQYGSKCYRKNPSHKADFYHPAKRKLNSFSEDEATRAKVSKRDIANTKYAGPRTALHVYQEMQPFSLFLTKVHGIQDRFNSSGAMNLREILSSSMGTLKESCHFNFMFDIPWIMKQYEKQDREKPLLLVHGESGPGIKSEAAPFKNISLCRAKLEIAYGTHHTKMMLLLYESGLRVVIHTANLIENDWYQKTQGLWISPVFPVLKNSSEKGESPTNFKSDLVQYLEAYGAPKLARWERIIQEHDMSSACVHIVGSVPGRHVMSAKSRWGHLKLKKILRERGPDESLVKNWPVCGQFSSIGSLGANPEAWLLSEWGQSLSSSRQTMTAALPKSKCQLIFPSKENIRLSLEGYNGGGCVPYSLQTARKQPWLSQFFSQWQSEGRGRTKAVPHIKSYSRFSPDGTQAAWFLITSANLSKAAWGALEKKDSQLMIRSYELGVLFLPQFFGLKNSFNVTSKVESVLDSSSPTLLLPYDLPPTTYVKGDRPWFIDVPCVDLPDMFGTKWCPPL